MRKIFGMTMVVACPIVAAVFPMRELFLFVQEMLLSVLRDIIRKAA